MVTVSAGTDTYGRVKNVCGTPIVTKFAMLQFLPLYPLQSFYFMGSGPTETRGIPLVASTQSTALHGIQLASIDRTSVTVAYIRGICATLVLFGFIGTLVPGIMYLSGTHLDEFAMTAIRWLLAALVVGVVVGVVTYLIPLTTQREREIRTYCHELLGIAVDPARVPSHAAKRFCDIADQCVDSVKSEDREKQLRDLIHIRATLAIERRRTHDESATDDILTKLRR